MQCKVCSAERTNTIWRKCSPKRSLVSVYSTRLYRDLATQKLNRLANNVSTPYKLDSFSKVVK